jgi:hypothetical protein
MPAPENSWENACHIASATDRLTDALQQIATAFIAHSLLLHGKADSSDSAIRLARKLLSLSSTDS